MRVMGPSRKKKSMMISTSFELQFVKSVMKQGRATISRPTPFFLKCLVRSGNFSLKISCTICISASTDSMFV